MPFSGKPSGNAARTPLRNFLVHALLSDNRFRFAIVPERGFFPILPIFAVVPSNPNVTNVSNLLQKKEI